MSISRGEYSNNNHNNANIQYTYIYMYTLCMCGRVATARLICKIAFLNDTEPGTMASNVYGSIRLKIRYNVTYVRLPRDFHGRNTK